VIVAGLAGGVGWYQYLTRAPAPVWPVALTDSATRPSASATTAPPPVPAARLETASEGRDSLPLSAREIADRIRSDPGLPQREAFDRDYGGREVTWAGRVTSASRIDTLLRFEFTDGDGIHLTAWCAADQELSPGASVTVRGRLAQGQADGFVIDRCRIL